MTEQTPEDLRAAADRDELEARILERALDELAPRDAPHVSRLSRDELPRAGAYPDDDDGRAHFARDLAATRLEWLLGRYREHSARAERRREHAANRALGIERFAGPGRFKLEDLAEPGQQRRRAAFEAKLKTLDAAPGHGLVAAPTHPRAPRARGTAAAGVEEH